MLKPTSSNGDLSDVAGAQQCCGVIEQLQSATESADWRKIQELLGSLDEDGFAAAHRWWIRRGRAAARRLDEQFGKHPASWDGLATARLLAIAFAPSGGKAAGLFNWAPWNGTRDGSIAVLETLGRQHREWCIEFVEAASQVSVPSWTWRYEVVDICRPLISRLGLPLPSGRSYVGQWAQDHAAAAQVATAPPGLPHQPAEERRHVELRLGADGRAFLESRLYSELRLVDVLDDDSRLAETLSAAIREVGVIGAFANVNTAAGSGWSLLDAIPVLVERGRLDRERIIDDCLEAATRRDAAGTQRALAQLLTAVELTAADLSSRIPLVLGAHATAHRSLTGVLLPPTIAAVTDADDLAELAIIVFGRTEKKQQNELLAALCAPDAPDRFARDGVLRALESAAALDDLRLAAKASKALAALGQPATTAADPDEARSASVVSRELWEAEVAPPVVLALAPVDPTPAGLTALLSELAVGPTITGDARMLEALVAFAHRDRQAAFSWAMSHDNPWILPSGLQAARRAIGRRSSEHDAYHVLSIEVRAGRRRPPNERYRPESAPSAFRALHEREVASRLGPAPCLLSTPSDDTGIVSFDALLDRLSRLEKSGYGFLDLLQALLRLEHVDPSRVGELDGLEIANLVPFTFPQPKGVGFWPGGDAAELTRRWVLGGGARYPDAIVTEEGLANPPAEFPVRTRVFDPYLDALRVADRHFGWGNLPVAIGVLPRWAEYTAAHLDGTIQWSTTEVPTLSALVRAGHAGWGVHQAVARTLSHTHANSRLIGADAVLTLIGRGVFDPQLFGDVCLHLHAAGQLPLARTASALEQVVLGGGLRQLWPVALRLAETACTAERLPAGTAELLGLLRRFAPSVPERGVPAGIRALAERRGGSKSEVEARAVVAELGAQVGVSS